MFKLNLANISDETRKSHAPVNQGSLKVVFTLPDNTEHIATEEFRLDLPVSYLKAYLDRMMLFNQSVIDVASSGKVLDDVLSLVDVGFVGGQVAQIEVRRAQDADAAVPLQRPASSGADDNAEDDTFVYDTDSDPVTAAASAPASASASATATTADVAAEQDYSQDQFDQ